MRGHSQCVPELMSKRKNSVQQKGIVKWGRVTWKAPTSKRVWVSYRYADTAAEIEDLCKSKDLFRGLPEGKHIDGLILNTGLHYPENGNITTNQFVAAVEGAMECILGSPRLRTSPVVWVEQQLIPPKNRRAFLSSPKNAAPIEDRRRGTNALMSRLGIPVVETSRMLRQTLDFPSTPDLHQQASVHHRASLLWNVLGDIACLS